MNLLVCFKIVPDLEQISDSEWKDPDELEEIFPYTRSVWSCYDESALELTLKLSDLSEGFHASIQKWALTVTAQKIDAFAATLYALGYDKVIRIEDRKCQFFCPEETAEQIAAYVRKFPEIDGIIMGRASSDGENSKVSLLTAEALHWDCITQTTALEPISEEELLVSYQTEEGIAKRKQKLPCVFSIGNAPCTYLRVPTLMDRMKRGKRPLELVTYDPHPPVRIPGKSVQLEKLTAVEQIRKTAWIIGADEVEKAKVLYDSFLRERLKNL